MNKKLKEIEFAKEFRCFKKGTKLVLNDGLTLITGENGAGKSSLIGAIRALYKKTKWSHSDLGADGVLVNESIDEACLYIDLDKDLLRNRIDFDDDLFLLQTSLLHKSSGQGALHQLIGLLDDSKQSMVIIDEPERGLSEANQFIVGKYIERFILKNPDVQVIVNTHSFIIMEILQEYSPIYCMPKFVPITLEKYKEFNERLGALIWSQYERAMNNE